MTAQQINDRLKAGERISLECKKAIDSLPKSVWETYSAFANTTGGTIILGIEEYSDRRFLITGVNNALKIISDFWNTINSDKVNHNILYDKDVHIVEIDEKQVICIDVPQADWHLKPIYINGNVYKGSFKRNHQGDYHCTEEEIKAMIRDANDNGNDGTLIDYYSMDDIDSDSLHQYRTEFRILNSGHIWNNIDDKEFLTMLGGYTVDRRTGQEGLTLAGLMMFGKGLPIRERFANFRMDYIDMSHLANDERYHNRLTYDGRWENNIYQFYHFVIPRLMEDLPRPFKMDGIRRDDDRLHLHNPGSLKLPTEQIYKGGSSRARNPRIQTMFRMIGYGENIGSGFPMIISAWEQMGWKRPLLENNTELGEVELTLYLHNRNRNGSVSQTMSQTMSQTNMQSVLELITDNPIITLNEIAEKTGKSLSTVKRYIAQLKKDKKIERTGPMAYGGYWKIVKEE